MRTPVSVFQPRIFIEPLESRIAPAAVFTFTDVDGDTVKVTSSKGSNADLQTATHLSAGQLTLLDLSQPTWGDEFKGASITVAVSAVGAAGDGTANVGGINGTGIDLGSVRVGGDLGKIVAGTGSAKVAAIKLLSAHSLGKQGTSTGAPDLQSIINGSLGGSRTYRLVPHCEVAPTVVTIWALRVSGDVQDALVSANAIGPVKIGGSLIGGTVVGSGVITATDGGIGKVKIGGDIKGGGANSTGRVFGATKLHHVTVGGSVIGGAFGNSGMIHSNGSIGAVKIGGDLRAGGGDESGKIDAGQGGIIGKIASIKIGGGLVGGGGKEDTFTDSRMNVHNGQICALGKVGPVRIVGDVKGGGGNWSGGIDLFDRVASVSIGGSVTGGGAQFSGSILLGHVASFTMLGDLIGGSGDSSALLDLTDARLMKIGGSVTGGEGEASAGVRLLRVDSLAIGGNVTGGSKVGAGEIRVLGDIVSLAIGGSVTEGDAEGAGWIRFNGNIDSLKIGGDLSGTGTRFEVVGAIENIHSVTIGGTVTRTQIAAGGFFGNLSNRQIGTVKVGGDWIASDLINGAQNLGADRSFGGFGPDADNVNFGDTNDILFAGAGPSVKIARITIGGQILGTAASGDHFGFVAGKIGSFKVGGVAIPLTAGAHNDNRPIGTTGDVTIHEV